MKWVKLLQVMGFLYGLLTLFAVAIAPVFAKLPADPSSLHFRLWLIGGSMVALVVTAVPAIVGYQDLQKENEVLKTLNKL